MGSSEGRTSRAKKGDKYIFTVSSESAGNARRNTSAALTNVDAPPPN
jgi:hypothetical protein